MSLAGVRKGVAHEVHPAALPGGLQDLGGVRLDARKRGLKAALTPIDPGAGMSWRVGFALLSHVVDV